jgi:hypothetical protein
MSDTLLFYTFYLDFRECTQVATPETRGVLLAMMAGVPAPHLYCEASKLRLGSKNLDLDTDRLNSKDGGLPKERKG